MNIPTDPKAAELYYQAWTARGMVQRGMKTYEEAKPTVAQYVDYVNNKAAEISKRHGLTPRKALTITGFMR